MFEAIGSAVASSALKAAGSGLTSGLTNLVSGVMSGKDVTTIDRGQTTTQKKVLSQEAFDKIVADILGSEQGLAQLVQGEKTAGLYGSTTSTMMAQDFAADLAGQLAALTAETVTQTDSRETQKKRKKSVICTALMEAGRLDPRIYRLGLAYFNKLPDATVYGYMAWGQPIADKIAKNPTGKLADFWLMVANARYQHLAGRKNFVGFLTFWVLQPISTLIGHIKLRGDFDGNQATVA